MVSSLRVQRRRNHGSLADEAQANDYWNNINCSYCLVFFVFALGHFRTNSICLIDQDIYYVCRGLDLLECQWDKWEIRHTSTGIFVLPKLKTLEWDILNPDYLIWVFNGHTFDFLLNPFFWISLLYKSYVW